MEFSSDFSDNAAILFKQEETDELARRLARGEYLDETTGNISSDFEYLGGSESEAWKELRDYGQKLLASDAAIEAFTDSLLSNALMISDVSEKQRNNMMNFLDSEQIEEIRLKKEADIKKDGIDEAEKEEYAKAMGYDFIDGKFYVGTGADQKEVKVSDNSIAAQLAGIKTQENLTEKMEALDGVLGNIDEDGEELDSIFERMT